MEGGLRSIDTYWQTLSIQTGTSGYGSAGPKVRLRVEQQLWFSAGRIGLTRSRVLSIHFPSTTAHRAWEQAGRPSFNHPAQRIATLGANRYLLGDLQRTRRQLLTFTTDPRELYRRLYAAGGSTHEVFVESGDQLRNRPQRHSVPRSTERSRSCPASNSSAPPPTRSAATAKRSRSQITAWRTN